MQRYRRFKIGTTTVTVDLKHHTVRTVFEGGAELMDAPAYGGADVARAIACGYTGDDPSWSFTAEHHLTYVALAKVWGRDRSPTLYARARGVEVEPAVAAAEEAEVMRAMRLINLVRGELCLPT